MASFNGLLASVNHLHDSNKKCEKIIKWEGCVFAQLLARLTNFLPSSIAEYMTNNPVWSKAAYNLSACTEIRQGIGVRAIQIGLG